ncbi:MAG: hypothetical protein CMQ21_15520 [Gammaproteobacteria bacterium]|nr:hypothetical protein [Gammaproteobacteria bacterium]
MDREDIILTGDLGEDLWSMILQITHTNEPCEKGADETLFQVPGRSDYYLRVQGDVTNLEHSASPVLSPGSTLVRNSEGIAFQTLVRMGPVEVIQPFPKVNFRVPANAVLIWRQIADTFMLKNPQWPMSETNGDKADENEILQRRLSLLVLNSWEKVAGILTGLGFQQNQTSYSKRIIAEALTGMNIDELADENIHVLSGQLVDSTGIDESQLVTHMIDLDGSTHIVLHEEVLTRWEKKDYPDYMMNALITALFREITVSHGLDEDTLDRSGLSFSALDKSYWGQKDSREITALLCKRGRNQLSRVSTEAGSRVSMTNAFDGFAEEVMLVSGVQKTFENHESDIGQFSHNKAELLKGVLAMKPKRLDVPLGYSVHELVQEQGKLIKEELRQILLDKEQQARSGKEERSIDFLGAGLGHYPTEAIQTIQMTNDLLIEESQRGALALPEMWTLRFAGFDIKESCYQSAREVFHEATANTAAFSGFKDTRIGDLHMEAFIGNALDYLRLISIRDEEIPAIFGMPLRFDILLHRNMSYINENVRRKSERYINPLSKKSRGDAVFFLWSSLQTLNILSIFGRDNAHYVIDPIRQIATDDPTALGNESPFKLPWVKVIRAGENKEGRVMSEWGSGIWIIQKQTGVASLSLTDVQQAAKQTFAGENSPP